MRRLRPLALLLLGAAGVVTLGYVGLRFVQWGWRLGFTEHRVLVGSLIFWAGAAIAFLAFLLIIETRIGFLRARRDLRDEQIARSRRDLPFLPCAVCGGKLEKPYSRDDVVRSAAIGRPGLHVVNS